MLIAFHKPYRVLSQFTADGSPNRPLGEFGLPQGVYPIGRLDADSEGLLLLSDEARWNERLLHPRHAHEREYWVQVERMPERAALEQLQRGVTVLGRKTLPCRAWILDPQPLAAPGTESGSDLPSSVPHPQSSNQAALACAGGAGSVKIFPRTPPIRFRKSVPDCWLGLELIEGKNRQVRRMTAAAGHPTLRLLRVRIGNFWLGEMPPGSWRALSDLEIKQVAA